MHSLPQSCQSPAASCSHILLVAVTYY
jgi:hypothetical protein